MKESIKVSAVALGDFAGDVFDPNCPSRILLDHVTSRWGVLVLVALSNGTMRWGEVRRWVKGITEKMLAHTLRTLEADGLVLRDAHPVVPPRVDYSLTERGQELVELLLPLVEWATAHAVPATPAPANPVPAAVPAS
ncbi:helix-turn-helix domain-containing protein [Streptacidiphilus sp. P02-A3a]|uniref:winged helix-turn-helix transcriptional regulator n=1 Tax=Streptacidiphilus sp. P02-A3a TaxID=2704468 RepID=UPI0015FA93D9|nr:helix-turn-helix domain-containing protein [Streptacidiphilus sp. P02-A3a]QMU70085.1 helix-turn-helix transcriptional regulator [Streptacidiphilus sp. P02-A3a]QMU70462.1 helix-turn-helix transcriptional regulator [Streptacidiphilus sp. P02-A3a]